MTKRIVNMTLDPDDLEKYKEILRHNPRLCGNVSKAIGEFIRQNIDEYEHQKKLETQQELKIKRNMIETVLSRVFFDSQKHVQFSDWDEDTLYNFVRMTREASNQAEFIFKKRFGRKIYLQDKLIYDRQ